MKKIRATAAQMEEWRDALMVITEELKPATVRQVFYQCTVRGLIEKTENGYARVARTLADLRRDGKMPFSWLADATRWQRKPRCNDSLADAIQHTAQFYRRHALSRSERYVEVWLEKDALAGVVFDATKKFDTPLMVARGFASLSFLHTAAETIRYESRPTTIYHLGDYDPSGQQAAKSTKESLYTPSGRDDLEFVQLAVLPEQITEWQLPSRPTKFEGNRHAKHWKGESVELDAIHPAKLRSMVTEALHNHLPADELGALRAAEESEREALKIFGKEFSLYGESGAYVLELFTHRMEKSDL